MMDRRRRVLVTAISLVLLGIQPGCSSSEDGTDGTNGPRPVGRSTSAPAGSTEVVAPECRNRSDRVVEQLPDVVVPAVEVPQVTDAEGRVVVEGFTVEAQIVDAGCVIRYDAPGGCLGAVEVTGATIPAATVPASRVGDVIIPAVTAPAVSVPGSRADQVCQVEEQGRLATVTREGVVREGFSRNGVARPGGSFGGVDVPTVRLEPVRLPDVDVDPGRLVRRELTRSVEVGVLSGAGGTSYVAPSGVLFDTDEARLRPDAVSALRTIAREIRRTAPAAELVVEGHTDDRGDEQYGLELSRLRARAVAVWLADHGFASSSITTRGFGETEPVVPNTSDANRQQNRRVVITVRDR